jgi:hypothetical protein
MGRSFRLCRPPAARQGDRASGLTLVEQRGYLMPVAVRSYKRLEGMPVRTLCPTPELPPQL